VEKQAVSTDLAATSYQSADGYSLERRFTIAAVPGAQAAVYGPQASKSNQSGGSSHTSKSDQGEGVAVVVFPEGRYVVTDFVQMTSATKAQAEATSLTKAEETHLHQIGSGFTLSVTHLPLEASLIFAGVTVGVAALVVLVPLGVSRARRRQRLAREAASRRAVQGRGRKIARHQAARFR
jgi:Flp pilus assembly protein TadB